MESQAFRAAFQMILARVVSFASRPLWQQKDPIYGKPPASSDRPPFSRRRRTFLGVFICASEPWLPSRSASVTPATKSIQPWRGIFAQTTGTHWLRIQGGDITKKRERERRQRGVGGVWEKGGGRGRGRRWPYMDRSDPFGESHRVLQLFVRFLPAPVNLWVPKSVPADADLLRGSADPLQGLGPGAAVSLTSPSFPCCSVCC